MQILPTSCKAEPQPSSIPGNIGTLKSKVTVWEHDPMHARPHQVLAWSFTAKMKEQTKNVVPTAFFELGSVLLKPIFKHHDMFICTINKKLAKEQEKNIIESPATGTTTVKLGVDFVGSPESGTGQIALDKMPGGKIYECNGGQSEFNSCLVGNDTSIDADTGRDIFPHQVWKHIGSLFDESPLIHPSEYHIPFSQLGAVEASFADPQKNIANQELLEKLQSSAKWDYIENTVNGTASIWPLMITKHSPDLGNSVHWSLEKWTPVWQGQDFFISVKLRDKETDDARDPNTGGVLKLNDKYNKFLNYDLATNKSKEQFPGLTNEAFYIPPTKATPNSKKTQEELDKQVLKQSRKLFDWRYKTYLLIEIGINDPLHNYFIELVKGRQPRFLHLGEEWDIPGRLEEGFDLASGCDQQAKNCKPYTGFNFYKKCRELSVYQELVSDVLFDKDFSFSVRNHLGRIVITFTGHEGKPWVIDRKDNDPTKRDLSKISIPMVVPSAPIRIHGGNISCAINYSPTQYAPSAIIPFLDRQIDTGPDNNDKVKNEDIYMTFSHMGNGIQYDNPSVKSSFFDDSRLDTQIIGYDCDAYLTHEIRQNRLSSIRIYEQYNKQYRIYGKGWYNKTPRNPSRQSKVDRDPKTQLPRPTTTINAMAEAHGGSPSFLRVINWANGSQSFPLTLNRPEFAHYQWKDFVAKWDVGIELKAGSVNIFPPSGNDALPVNDNFGPKVFENYISPIATSWRIIVLGGGKPFGGSVTPFDMAPLVSSIHDSWSAEDFTSLSHEMKIECYIPIEATSPDNPKNILNKDLINLFNLGRKILSLHDKTFYLTVSYWWEKGIGHRFVESNTFNEAGQDPNQNDALIQMTGLAYGAQLTRSNNRLIMSFTVKDYMSILENQFIFNSPFFDAVQDVSAIHELGKLAGLADTNKSSKLIDRRPLGYLRKVISEGNIVKDRTFIYNGEKSRSERYDLPGTYSTFPDPKVKFQNGETFENAVKRLAQLSGKAIYFDRWGVLRLETPPALTAAFSAASKNLDLQLKPVFDFVSTPIVRQSNIPNAGESSTKSFSFNSSVHAAHLVYNAVSYQRSVEDCANQIIIMSASNDLRDADGKRKGGFILEGYTFFDQMWKPESEGFIGYRKPMYQEEGSFGSVQGVRNAIGIYAKKKFPPVIMNFETYGVPGLKALDIITLDGNLAYITEISHELNPSENRWWCNIQSEWLKPLKGELGFLETTEPDTSKSNN